MRQAAGFTVAPSPDLSGLRSNVGLVEWRPLHLRNRPDAEASYPVLVDGVPEWLEPSLFRWVADRAATGGHGLARRAEQLLRIRLPNPSNREYQLVAYWRNATDTDRLTLIDFILAEWERLYDAAQRDFHGHDTAQEVVRAIDSMAGMLTDGGSLWRFETDPHWCLVRRVTEAAEQQYATATSPSSDAANRLKRAWTACYRQSPNYDEAYRNAVLAVEAVVLPVTIPNDTSGTLGKAVRNIKDTRARWTVGGLTSEGPSGADALITMLDLLWKNQERHARSDGTIADVSGPEAETAVGLAVALVQWFNAGLVHRA